MKQRLDAAMVTKKLVASRSQAESWIRLGKVRVNGVVVQRAGQLVNEHVVIVLDAQEQYVSRAGLKLASVAERLNLDFRSTTVLDVGSSTGGFTDYALQHGASQVIAVDVGTDQLHPKLRADDRVELHEKTDIRSFTIDEETGCLPDIIVMDVSFISLREILPHIARQLCKKDTQVVAMLKPQFEAGREQINKGVIKNDAIRRQILKDFEAWVRQYFVIIDKRDSDIAGAKGNQERFYLLKLSGMKA